MQRLTSKKDYNRLRNVSQKIVGKYFIVVYIYDELRLESAAGITVSKKVGNAVVRNKVKRRIKAFLRNYELGIMNYESNDYNKATSTPSIPNTKYQTHKTTHFLCNIIALSSVVNADWQAFQRDLTNCLRKLEVRSEK